MKHPFVSIIITTRNEEKHIGSCLVSISKQTYRNIEVIVIDNASQDSTKQIARQYTSYVYNKGPERSAQRNFGVTKAKGDYMLFLDADMEVTPTVVEECVNLIHKPRSTNNELKGLVIPEKSIGSGFWAQCKILERSFYENVDWMEAARFFEKKTFMELHGYDETLTGPEDFDLPQRIKSHFGTRSIGRISSSIIHNEGELSLFQSIRKKFYYGKRLKIYFSKNENKETAKKQGDLFLRFTLFFVNPKKLFQNPFIGIGMLFMKITEMGALGIGYLCG